MFARLQSERRMNFKACVCVCASVSAVLLSCRRVLRRVYEFMYMVVETPLIPCRNYCTAGLSACHVICLSFAGI